MYKQYVVACQHSVQLAYINSVSNNVCAISKLPKLSSFLNFSVEARLALCVKEYAWPLPASSCIKTSLNVLGE